MLNILEPLASIARAIVFGIDSLSVRLVVFPLPLVDVSIGVDEPASTIGPILLPVSLVKREVVPYLLAPAIAHTITELPDVPDSIAHVDGPLTYKLCLVVFIIFEGA
jgi:hypothetical protein